MHLHLDHYLIATLYSSWVEGEHNSETVFELYFRKSPYKGEYTIFLGLSKVLDYLEHFKIDEQKLAHFKTIPQFVHYNPVFWHYLGSLNAKCIRLYGLNEGTVCFAHEPLIKIIGPLGFINLIGSALLCLTGYASLVATNASRFRLAANAINMQECRLYEFGLRRAQGPGAALIASLSSYIGGFDGTSNLDANEEYGIPSCGTMDHTSILVGVASKRALSKELSSQHKHMLNKLTNKVENFTLKCLEIEEDFVKRIVMRKRTLEDDRNVRRRDELQSFIKVAATNQSSFLALVDTYDVISSGLINYCIVALALIEFGHKPLGIRIDSGDLAYLSRCARCLFEEVAKEYGREEFTGLQIIVSNEISIKVILSLLGQKHAITGFGIGTKLVTCGKQPSLGTVFKMVEIEGIPCQKSSVGNGKTSIACRKSAYRFYDENNQALVDMLLGDREPVPKAGQPIVCRHPFDSYQKCVIRPARVEPLLHLWWDGSSGGRVKKLASIEEIRANCLRSLESLREDIKRFVNPTPYKVSVSEQLLEKLSKLKANRSQF